MNATCPRCGTVTLAGSQTTRFTCKTCHLHFCNECQHWQTERKQKSCARCGALFNDPPPVMPSRVAATVFYVPILAALLLSIYIPMRFWQMALAIVAPIVVYTSTYLMLFYRRTGLAQAVRREAILLARRALMLAAIVYVVMMLSDQLTLIIGVAIAAVLVLIGLAAQRATSAVIEELRANRPAWQAVLSISSWDALWMRFPETTTKAL
jgi:ribosomal protein S27AE